MSCVAWRRWRWFVAGWALVLTVLGVAVSVGRWPDVSAARGADSPTGASPSEASRGVDRRIEAHLAAGEFSPALRLARSVSASDRRDALLAHIAAAQLAAGEREAPLTTAATVRDDRIRAGILAQVAQRPAVGFGGNRGRGFNGGLNGGLNAGANAGFNNAATIPPVVDSAALGGLGGEAKPDFTSLIELITSTVGPQSWTDAGGTASVKEFTNGVYVDAEGVLRKAVHGGDDIELVAVRTAAARPKQSTGVRSASPLRKVSLTRLEKHLQLELAAGRPPTEAMRVLAGLQRIQYVLVYPESNGATSDGVTSGDRTSRDSIAGNIIAGDIVLAGPAGDWKLDGEDRVVSTDNGRPVVRLDDLVVMLRHFASLGPNRRAATANESSNSKSKDGAAVFGCSITPTQEGLDRLRTFVAESSKTKLSPRNRSDWLENLRSKLGRQTIDVFGIDPRTRAAQVIVEADYRMKLVGMGLEEGVAGVPSYLSTIHVAKGQAPPPMDVLRWWFALDYDAIRATTSRDLFELRGQGVQVLSENQLFSEQGERVHTGKSDGPTGEFAHNFTRHFAALARKYPVYAELQNVCDVALAAAIIHREDLPAKVGWHLTCFADPKQYRVALGEAPRTVETVIAHRVIDDVHVIAGVSGGVRVDPTRLVEPTAIRVEASGKLPAMRQSAAPVALAPGAWWWD